MGVSVRSGAGKSSFLTYSSLLHVFLSVLCGCIILSILILCYVPPVSKDALTYHLTIPKLYLQRGGIYEIPALAESYNPLLVELLYMIPLSIGNDILPAYIHFIFGLLTAVMVYIYLKNRLNTVYALTGVLLFLSLPVVIKLSITAYVDLALTFFSTASIFFILKWAENFRIKYLIIAAIFCGLALNTKYNAMIVSVLLTLFIPLIYLRKSEEKHRRQHRAVGYTAIFALICVLFFSPWIIRNYIWTKNPVYPLYKNMFNAPDSIKEKLGQTNETPTVITHFNFRHIFFEETWWQMALIPVRIFFEGQDENPKLFDGRLNPLLFFLPFFAFYGSSRSEFLEKLFLLGFAVCYLFITFFSIDMRIRYIIPIVPPLVILSIFGLHRIIELLKNRCTGIIQFKIASAVIFGILVFFFSMNAHYVWGLFKYVDPISYISGRVSRDEYITKYRVEHPVLQFANAHLSEHAKIFALFLGSRGYYCDREIIFDENIFLKIIKTSNNPQEILSKLNSKGITHLLIRHDLFNEWCKTNFDENNMGKLSLFANQHLNQLIFQNGYGLYELKADESSSKTN